MSRLTGLGIDTLRAWERRYNAVTPVRDDRGRIYSDADIARLRLLRGAVEQGHSIGRLAGLTDEALRRLTATAEPAAAPARAPVPPASPVIASLIASLHAYDSEGIDREITRLATLLRPIDLLQDVLMPALVQVGDDWHRGRATIAQEHLMSATVRHTIGAFLRLHARRDPPARLLFATVSGDRHEIGTLGAAMLAASSGLGVTYLGPDLPARDLVASAASTGAQVLVLGLTMGASRQVTARELSAIVQELPETVELWTGGAGAARHAAIISPRGLILGDYAAYQQELTRLGGRV